MPHQIFVSFSTRDITTANTILGGLKDRGVTSVFMSADPEEGIKAGEEWRKRLETELRYARLFMPLISQNWLQSSWCHAELRIAKFMGMSIFPVHIGEADTKGITGEIDELQGLSAYLPDEKSLDTLSAKLNERLKLRRGRWDGEIQRLYPAAAAYQADQSAVFFGRDEEIAKLGRDASAILERANPEERFLIYSSASGVGKSSLLRAGLLPELGVDKTMLVLGPLRPRDGLSGPGESLEAALLRLATPVGAAESERRARLADVRNWCASGADAIRAGLKDLATLRGARSLVVLVDQAEEWLLDDRDVARQRKAVLALLDRSWRQAACILVARDDAIAQLDALLPRSDGGRTTPTLLLRPMLRDKIREVIRGPLEIASLIPIVADPSVDAFVDAVLEDAEGAQDALPLVSQLLARLVGEGRGALTATHYAKIGGLTGAIADAADGCLPDVKTDPATLSAVRSAFMAMASVDTFGKITIGRVALSSVPEDARPVLERMAAPGVRLLRRSGESFEPTHESLLRRWPRLAEWLQEEAGRMAILAQALRDAEAWEASGRLDDLLLHRGERLAAVGPLLDDPIYVSKFYAALDYIKACWIHQDAQERERRTREQQVSTGLSRILANRAREHLKEGFYTKAMRHSLAGWLEGKRNGGETAHAEAALAAAAHLTPELARFEHKVSDVSARGTDLRI